MARPKKSEARDTRHDILDAALDLFAEQGFFATSMRQIARAVKVRESALYHHFESKQAILDALISELGPGRVAQLESVDVAPLLSAMGGLEFLRSMLHMLVTEWAAPREMKFLRLLLTEGFRLNAAGLLKPAQNARKALAMVSRLFAELMRQGVIREANPETVALSFMAPMVMLRMLHLAMPEGPPDVKALLAQVDRHLEFSWENLQKQNGRSVKKGRGT